MQNICEECGYPAHNGKCSFFNSAYFRARARVKTTTETNTKSWYKRWWAIVGYVFVGFCIVVVLLANSDTNTTTKVTGEIINEANKETTNGINNNTINKTGKIYEYLNGTKYSVGSIGTASFGYIVKKKKNYDSMVNAIELNDTHGFYELLELGKVFSIIVYKTQILILDIDTSNKLYEIKILDGKNEGETGWISVDLINIKHNPWFCAAKQKEDFAKIAYTAEWRYYDYSYTYEYNKLLESGKIFEVDPGASVFDFRYRLGSIYQ